MTLADQIIHYYRELTYTGATLPPGIRIMNPFREDEQVMQIVEQFYHKFYNDNKQRCLVLGINPGRFGGGLTGIPFTDPKRLQSECHIAYTGKVTHEPSSVFVYEVIQAYGGAEEFYGDIYINSVCPLGFTSIDAKGREKNYNYYDSPELMTAVKDFAIDNIQKQTAMGVAVDTCFCLGTGKNEKYLRRLNDECQFFKNLVVLEHPRFIMQYKMRNKQYYIDKYVDAFKSVK